MDKKKKGLAINQAYPCPATPCPALSGLDLSCRATSRRAMLCKPYYSTFLEGA